MTDKPEHRVFGQGEQDLPGLPGLPDTSDEARELAQRLAPALRAWTIYKNPSDFPGKFVVRIVTANSVPPHEPIPDRRPTAVVDTLEQARAALPEGLTRLLPDEIDDPVIVELWL